MSTATRAEAAAGYVLKLKAGWRHKPIPFEHLREFKPGAWLQAKVRGGTKSFLLLQEVQAGVALSCWDPFAKSDAKRIVELPQADIITTFNAEGAEDARITDHRTVNISVPTPLRNPLPWVA